MIDYISPATPYKDFSIDPGTASPRIALPSPSSPDLSANLFPAEQEHAGVQIVPLCWLAGQLATPGPVAWLSATEQNQFDTLGYPKRRLEWLGGRLAIKRAIAALLREQEYSLSRYDRISILADSRNRPQLYWLEAIPLLKRLHISISHSHGFAAASTCLDHACGVDIQKILTRISNVERHFCCKDEYTMLRNIIKHHSRDTILTILWSAKEAVKKQISGRQPGLFAGINLIRIAPQKHENSWCLFCSSPERTAGTIAVQCQINSGYCLALAGKAYARTA